MSPRSEPGAGPLGRRLSFFLVTVFALGMDVLVLVPEGDERQGQGWTAFGVWDTTVLQFCLAVAVAYSILLLRRRFPLPVLLAMAILSSVLTEASTSGQPIAGLLVSLYAAASLAERRWHASVALVIAVAAMCLCMLQNIGWQDPDLELALLLIGGMTYSVWLFGRKEHAAFVSSSELPGRLAEHGELAAAAERHRIARELHDILAHSVSAMMMQAAGAKAVTTVLCRELPSERRLEVVGRALETIEATGSQSMRELHRLLDVMRGDGEHDRGTTEAESGSQPAMADMERLVAVTRESGLCVETFSAGAPMQLDPSVGLAGYRVVQESLTNAMKHGGRGASVQVFQNWLPDGLRLQVRSRKGAEGTAPGSMGGGGGLDGLRERVEVIGGDFTSGWADDEFVVTVLLPLTPAGPPTFAVDSTRGHPSGEQRL